MNENEATKKTEEIILDEIEQEEKISKKKETKKEVKKDIERWIMKISLSIKGKTYPKFFDIANESEEIKKELEPFCEITKKEVR